MIHSSLILCERILPSNPSFAEDLSWLTEAYSKAVIEELSNSPAGRYRSLNPKKMPQIKDTLSWLLSDPQKACGLLAKKQGERCGYFLGVIKDCLGEDPGEVGYINGLYIEHSFRRQGIAQKLLNEGLVWFKEMNLNLAELYISLGNKEGKLFWEKNGYFACEEVMIRKLD